MIKKMEPKEQWWMW